MSYSRTLLKNTQPYIDAQVQKPFLQGLLNGDLPVACFEYWLKVDYPYLLNFIQMMAVGLSKSNDPQDMWVFLEHIKNIQKEMQDHEGHAARIGLSKDELFKHRPGPLKYSYMRHQLSAAHHGPPVEAIASALACQWGYGECARTLLKLKPLQPDNPYSKWFAFHASEEHLPGLHMSLDMIDRHAAVSQDPQLRRIEEIFLISVQHETMLWDEYYQMSQWETH